MVVCSYVGKCGFSPKVIKSPESVSTVIPMKLTAYLTVIMISVLLLLATVYSAAAQTEITIVAGVKPGDQFTYTITGSYSQNAPLESVPAEVINAAASSYFKITIVNVSNPNVGYTYIWHFANGTDQNGDGIANLEIPSEDEGPFWTIVPANLTKGQKIHEHFGDQSTFNDTIMWNYANYTRETNFWQTSSEQVNNSTGVDKYRTVNSDIYFDKQTGMLVSLNEQSYYQNPTFTTTITWTLAGQTAWDFSSQGSYPPTPFWTLPVIIAVGVVIGVLVVALGWFLSGKRAQARRKQLLKKK